MAKVGKLTGEGRNRARSGVTGQGVWASLQEVAGIGGGQEWKRQTGMEELNRGAACALPALLLRLGSKNLN